MDTFLWKKKQTCFMIITEVHKNDRVWRGIVRWNINYKIWKYSGLMLIQWYHAATTHKAYEFCQMIQIIRNIQIWRKNNKKSL